MATFTKIDAFVEAVAEKKHDLGSDTLKVMLTNTAHTATWDTLSDLTAAANFPANVDGNTITTTSSAQTSGTYKLTLTDLVMTASGAVGPFRYVYIYNDTSTNDDLIAYYDYGSEVTLASGDTFTIDFDASNGFLTIA